MKGVDSGSRLVQIIPAQPMVPILTIDRVEDAVPLARALADGGLTTMEITLRTDASLPAIEVICETLSDVTVGVGTVRSAEQAEWAIVAGAKFIVSPGMTQSLIDAAQYWPVPFLPGASTVSEAMTLADHGYSVIKFFPAEQSGGVGALKAIGAPLPDILFCPTGGINAANACDYLALSNVIAVGGSWVVPAEVVRRGDWAAVSALAQDAASLQA